MKSWRSLSVRAFPCLVAGLLPGPGRSAADRGVGDAASIGTARVDDLPIRLHLDQKGTVLTGGKPLDEAKLKAYLLRRANDARGAATLEVLIAAHPNVDYEKVLKLIQQVRQCGYRRMRVWAGRTRS